MADVFLSYKRADQARAAQIAKAIEAHGYSVFFDAEIAVGESWTSRIEQELAAAKCCVVLWSKHSKPTDAGKWVHNEARNAMARSVLAPALIDDSEPPVEFSGEQAAKLASWRGDPSEGEWKKLIERISHCVRQPPKRVAAKPWLRRSVLLGGSVVGLSAAAAAAGAFIVPRLTAPDADPLAGLTGAVRDVAARARAASAEASSIAAEAETVWQAAQENMLLADASPDDSRYEVGAAEDGVGVYKGEARRRGAPAVGVFTKAGDYTYGGQWEGSLFRGLGKKEVSTSAGLEKQSGRFVATVLNGKGTIEFADGAVYKGDLVAGMAHGVGVMTAAPPAEGAPHEFVGAFVAGRLEGLAVEYDGQGAIVYDRRWRNGLRVDGGAAQISEALTSVIALARQREASAREIAQQGRNSADLANEYAERARRAHQSGVDLAALGLLYIAFDDWGEYAGQVRNEPGALGYYRAADTGESYSGAWNGVEFQQTHDGFGVYTFPNATSGMTSQAGRFLDCCQTEQGEIVFVDGRVYRGDVVADVATGAGVTVFPDGSQRVGEHVNGVLQGDGVEFDASGAITRQGRWNEGQLAP